MSNTISFLWGLFWESNRRYICHSSFPISEKCWRIEMPICQFNKLHWQGSRVLSS